jgi:hypothetical protein
MRRLLALALVSLFLAGATTAKAGKYSFTPNPKNLDNLAHQDAYIWGMDTPAGLASDLAKGMVISKVEITITDIWDWKATETNVLFIDLLDNPEHAGVTKITDDPNDTLTTDWFKTATPKTWTGLTSLDSWSDEHGGKSHDFNLVYDFNTTQIADLVTDLTDPRTTYTDFVSETKKVKGHWKTEIVPVYTESVDFGLAFAPDCHFYNKGITLVISTEPAPHSVPDSSATLALLGIALLGMSGLKRLICA